MGKMAGNCWEHDKICWAKLGKNEKWLENDRIDGTMDENLALEDDESLAFEASKCCEKRLPEMYALESTDMDL